MRLRIRAETSPSPGFLPGRAGVYIYDELNLIGRASDAGSIRIRR